MVRSVRHTLYGHYLQKAEEMLKVAKYALKRAKAFDAAVINAVYSAISAVDAWTVFRVGKRGSGSREDVMILIRAISSPAESEEISTQFWELLILRNSLEDHPGSVNQVEAKNAVARAEHIFGKVKASLPSSVKQGPQTL
jgi:HEPN domain-containing protein